MVDERALFDAARAAVPMPPKVPKGNPYAAAAGGSDTLRAAVENAARLVLEIRTGDATGAPALAALLAAARASPSDLADLGVLEGNALHTRLLNILRPLHEGEISSPVPRHER